MSALLAQFTVEFDKISKYVVGSEGNPLVSSPCPCGEGLRTTRCTDCTMQDPVCNKCFILNHATQPFHFADTWNGSYFVKSSQAELGRVIHLGHGGVRCPFVYPEAAPLLLDVVDLNGVHGCKVHYCKCKRAGHHWEQLLLIDLFPGTLAKTATAFSFAVLKNFDLLSSISKTSAMDFVTTLRRTTNNAFPDDVPVCQVLYLVSCVTHCYCRISTFRSDGL